MKHKKSKFYLVFLFLASGGLFAQESVNGSGGEATGISGQVSYSIGQTVYTTNTGSDGSVIQGVQQPYEIYETTGLSASSIHLDISVFPNPTVHLLNLKIDGKNLEGISYSLIDVRGKEIKSRKVSDKISIINMEGLSKATYFLKVKSSSNETIKTFKVLKN